MAKRKKKNTPSANPLEDSLGRFRPMLSVDEYARLEVELKLPLFSAIRLNPLKATPVDLEKWKIKYGWELAPVPFCPAGYQVISSHVSPSQTLEHKLGMFYIQDAASMLPVELFKFENKTQPLILDLAASPGGKTTHLIANSNDQGFILANDSSRDRIQALKIVLQNWGGVNAGVCCFPGDKFGPWFPETFDHVLLDAPCSMEGLRTTDAHPLRPISDRERSSLARRQASLLVSALQAAKVGGQVVYSTCTLAAEEDESVVDQILRKYSPQVKIEPVDLHQTISPALTHFGGIGYLPETSRAARIWPHLFHTAGFFAARFTKLDSIPGTSEAYPRRKFSETGWFQSTHAKTKRLIGLMQEQFGFVLESLLENFNFSIWEHEEDIHLFPERFFEQFQDLPVQLLGIKLGELTKEGIVPGHDFCSRFFNSFTKSVVEIARADAVHWLNGNDLQEIADESVDKVVLLKDELNRFIGVGRAGNHRIKNLLPRRFIQQKTLI